MMDDQEPLKEKFTEVTKFKSVYSSGQQIYLSHDGDTVICGFDGEDGVGINIIDKENQSVKKLDIVDEVVINFTVSQRNSTLYLATKSALLQVWNWKTGKLIKHWKAGHSQRVSCIAVSRIGDRLVTGSSDRQLRLWRLTSDSQVEQVAVELMKIFPVGQDMPILASFHPRLPLAVSVTRAEAALRVWESSEGREIGKLSGHAGEVTGVEFPEDADGDKCWMISCCQGKLLLVWDLNKMEKIYTIPTSERLTSCLVVPNEYFKKKVGDAPLILTGGMTGILRLWRADKAACQMEIRRAGLKLASVDDDGEYGLNSIVRIVPGGGEHFLVVRASASLEFHRRDTPRVDFEWISEVGDVRRIAFCGPSHNCLAVLANGSSQLLLYPRIMGEPPSWQAVTVDTGHSQAVTDFAVSSDGQRLLTASKDSTIRLWTVVMKEAEGEEVSGLALKCQSDVHGGQVTAVTFDKGEGRTAYSAAEGEVRKWRIRSEGKTMDEVAVVSSSHRMMINNIVCDLKDKYLATSSKDKTIKIWTVEGKSLTERATLAGHKIGVWSAEFSPRNQRLISAAGDGVKLWSLEDFQCSATFESDGGPVYQAKYLVNGQQFISGDQSGRVILTTVKGQKVVQRNAAHEGRVWSVCVSPDESKVVSSSETGELILWKDVSEEERRAKQDELIRNYEIEDKVKKLLQVGKLHRALKFVIKADQPIKAYKIIRDIRLSENPVVLKSALDGIIASPPDLRRLLRYCVAWNSHNQRFLEAKAVVSHVLTSVRPEKLAEIGRGNAEGDGFNFDHLTPHFVRHQRREIRFARAAMLASYIHSLAGGVADGDGSTSMDLE